MDRIYLRPIVANDRDAVRDLFSDGKVAPFLASVAVPYDEKWFEKRMASQASGRLHFFAIEDEASRFLGLIGYFLDQTAPNSVADIMYCIHSGSWGQGITSRALPILIDKMRDAGVQLVKAGAHFDNPASIRLLEKNGFQFETEAMEFSLGRNAEVRTLLFSRAL